MTALQTTSSARLGALAKVEALRYAKHPVFLVGALLCAISVGIGVSNVTDDYYSPPMGLPSSSDCSGSSWATGSPSPCSARPRR